MDEDKDKIDLNKQYRIYLSDFNITRSRDLGITNSIQIEYNDVEMAGCNPDCYWNTVDTTSAGNGARCVTINLIDQTKKYILDRNYIIYADTAKEEYNFDGKYGPIPNDDGTVDLSNYASKYITNHSSITELPAENKEYLDEVLTTGKYKVTNMSQMFYECTSLTSLDVSNWDTGNVTNMRYMFYQCEKLTSLDVSNWDTSKVTSMIDMFNSCFALTSLDVSNWDTGNVTNMSYMFNYCDKLTTITGIIDLTSCTNYSKMLYNTSVLTSINIKLPSTITQSDFLTGSKVTNTSAVHFVS